MNQRDVVVMVALMRVAGAGNALARRALEMAQVLGTSLAEAIESNPRDLVTRLPSNVYNRVFAAARSLDHEAIDRAEQLVARVLRQGACCYTYTDEHYPALLSRHLKNAPALVWCVGNSDLLRCDAAGIVGTREPSDAGEAVAADCARFFVNEGACIVSGGAGGIDTVAHRATLDAGGSTIVVLPQGIHTYSFPAYIRDAIECGRCALMSQFDPEMNWQTSAAIKRNACIAALSKLVCVIEPKRMGGSMRTGKHAREQGKCVFYFIGTGPKALAAALNQSGALSIVSTHNRLNTNLIRDQWRNAPSSAPDQGRLL